MARLHEVAIELGVEGVEVVDVVVAAEQLVEEEERKLRLDEDRLVERLAQRAGESVHG